MKTFKRTTFRIATLAAIGLAAALTSSAQTRVFFEDFDVDHSLDNTWVTNSVGGYNPVNLYFDYSTVGIPPAPNSTGGTTRGLKLQANLDPQTGATTGVFPSGCSVSPVGFSITENFEMRWDWWLNFNGSPTTGLNGGGSGSTQIGGAGFGTAATTANVPTLIDAIFIGCSGDGSGTTADYRVYSPAFSASLQDASGVYAAGTTGSRNNTHEYYQATFTPQSATNNCPGQLALWPQTQFGMTAGGTAGMKWRDVSLKKVANIITYTIDGLLIATIDVSTNGTLGGANIVFGHFDINAGFSTDPNAVDLAFSLVDNVRITNFGTVVAVSPTRPDASEAGPTAGEFTFTRTSSGAPLTVNYTVGGTATPGDDYAALPGSFTFGATETVKTVAVVPVDDYIAETTETVILTISDSPNYQHGGSATITIADNEAPQLSITNISTQMYERVNDYATFRVTRLGDLNAGSFSANLAFSGTAVRDADYTVDALGTFDPGVQSLTFRIFPVEDTELEGDETVTVSIAPAGAGEYGVGSPSSASITLVDATKPPETVLFADDFSTDSSANWSVFATDPTDYTATFAFDYSSQGIPPAPHSSGDSFGLYLNANKDSSGAAAAVNVYPRGKSFSGNFALRFDMFLHVVVPNTVSTEYVLFGINHSGTKTNWFRNSPGGVPAGWEFDGVFYGIEADGAGLGDYANYSAPTTAANNPTSLGAGRSATTLTQVFKSPPWSVPGAPANNLSFGTPIWADVEVSQIGNLLTLKVNNTTIFSTINTTPFTSGNIMLGYNDAYDSIGLTTSYVVIDNVRVVRLPASSRPNITDIRLNGGNVEISFSAETSDALTAFGLQEAGTVNGTYEDVAASITGSGGSFKAVRALGGSAQFYRIKRN